MYDVAIIGTGIAGLSAALTLKLHHKNILWIGSKSLSAKIRQAEKIANYPGLSFVSGEEFASALQKQAEEAGLFITEDTVNKIYPKKDSFTVLSDREMYDAASVIIATGVEKTKSAEGEERFIGQGISYCATCDGFLYKGKKIAVVCASEEYEPEVDYLASVAAKVLLFPTYRNISVKAQNVEIIKDFPQKIIGTERAEGFVGKHGEYFCDGIFFLKNSRPLASLMDGIQTDGAHLHTERDMSVGYRGVFAAGDVCGKPYQYAKAAGEGNIAAHSVLTYLHQKDND